MHWRSGTRQPRSMHLTSMLLVEWQKARRASVGLGAGGGLFTMPWHIYHDGSNRWRWELLDPTHSLLLRSSTSFESREECLRNAQSHGYAGAHGGPLDHGSDERDEC
jgi:hypothetical protein